jgi:hypothetical protein
MLCPSGIRRENNISRTPFISENVRAINTYFPAGPVLVPDMCRLFTCLPRQPSYPLSLNKRKELLKGPFAVDCGGLPVYLQLCPPASLSPLDRQSAGKSGKIPGLEY